MSGKIKEPFGLVTQREWDGLIARGADLHHIAMYALLRVRADRDGISRDSVPALMRRTNRSEDTVERLLKWLRENGVIAQRRISARRGPEHVSWLYERRALSIDEWVESATVPPPSTNGVRNVAPSIGLVESANTTAGVRKSSRRSPQRLGDNPDVTQREPQPAGEAFLRGAREVSDEEREKLTWSFRALADSHHADAFANKRDELLALIQRHPDRDIDQAINDLITTVDVIRYDSKAIEILEAFAKRAPRVARRPHVVCKDHGEWDYDVCPKCPGGIYAFGPRRGIG